MKLINRIISVFALICLSVFIFSFSGFAATIPVKPDGLRAKNIKLNSVTLYWKESRAADFYKVYIKQDGEWVELEDTTETSCRVSGLEPSESYTFAVRSVNETDKRDYPSRDYATLKVKTKSLPKVKASAVSGVDYVKLKWSKVASVKGYNVYRKSGSKWKLVKKLSKSTQSYTVKNLKSDTAYQFSVRVRRTLDGKTVLGPRSAVKISTMRPNKVNLTVVSATDDSVKLKWTKAQDATGYRVYHYENGGWKRVKTVNSRDKLSAVITSLESDSRHKFRVKAFRKYSDRTVWFTASATKTAVTDPSKNDLKVYRTDNLRDLLSKNFTLSYKGENEDYGNTVITISKSGEKYYLYSKLYRREYELLNIDSGYYILLKDNKAYAKAPDAMSSALDVSSAVEDLLPAKRMKAKASLEEFEGRKVVCESYKNTTGTREYKYFYRAGELVGIEQYSYGKLVERAVITVFEQKALKGVFKVPSGYKVLS